MTPTCRYCKTEIEGGRLPFCSMQHFHWHFFGKPPLYDVLKRKRDGIPSEKPARPQRQP